MVARKTKVADGGRKDKGTGKAKNVGAGTKPKVYGNSNYNPKALRNANNAAYKGVPYTNLPEYARAGREAQFFDDLGPLAPLGVPGLGLMRVSAAISDTMNKGKNIVKAPPRTRSTKRGR